ncbi:hypothetical protein PCASD_18139 [Puccinia coronata f. sp. avenae]|uniref:No apical meristem-associated C-terminal domain-containing protein n=1 Tax=Puccinia coronata f. sp. avenae TaxID=200324 RepID=A0A2N5SVC2_9BASI|nr:hypothetical protein PCASD_18139 [Puccinia coronata f. sp. avenae]
MLAKRSRNYRKQTISMNQTNKIQDGVSKAEIHASNLEIMTKNPDKLPNDISQEFLKLQKQEILEDLQEQMKKKKAALGTRNIKNDALSTNNNIDCLSSPNLESKSASFQPTGKSIQDPSSQADLKYKDEDESNNNLFDEEEKINPTLEGFPMI